VSSKRGIENSYIAICPECHEDLPDDSPKEYCEQTCENCGAKISVYVSIRYDTEVINPRKIMPIRPGAQYDCPVNFTSLDDFDLSDDL